MGYFRDLLLHIRYAPGTGSMRHKAWGMGHEAWVGCRTGPLDSWTEAGYGSTSQKESCPPFTTALSNKRRLLMKRVVSGGEW